MSQVTLDKATYVSRNGFRNLGDFERAKVAYNTLFNNRSIEVDGKTYTIGRSGTLIPGKVTGSFPDLLKDKFGIPQDKLREAELAVIKDFSL